MGATYGRLDLINEIKANLYVPGKVKGHVHSLVAAYSLYIRPYPNKGIVFKVEPNSNGHADHYSGVLLEVFSMQSKLDGIYVPFDGLLVRAKDDRPDHVGPLHIWRSQTGRHTMEEDWYIGRPVNITPLVMLINNFIDFWTEA